MTVYEYALKVDKTVDEILMLCQNLGINVYSKDDILSDDDIMLLDEFLQNLYSDYEEEVSSVRSNSEISIDPECLFNECKQVKDIVEKLDSFSKSVNSVNISGDESINNDLLQESKSIGSTLGDAKRNISSMITDVCELSERIVSVKTTLEENDAEMAFLFAFLEGNYRDEDGSFDEEELNDAIQDLGLDDRYGLSEYVGDYNKAKEFFDVVLSDSEDNKYRNKDGLLDIDKIREDIESEEIDDIFGIIDYAQKYNNSKSFSNEVFNDSENNEYREKDGLFDIEGIREDIESREIDDIFGIIDYAEKYNNERSFFNSVFSDGGDNYIGEDGLLDIDKIEKDIESKGLEDMFEIKSIVSGANDYATKYFNGDFNDNDGLPDEAAIQKYLEDNSITDIYGINKLANEVSTNAERLKEYNENLRILNEKLAGLKSNIDDKTQEINTIIFESGGAQFGEASFQVKQYQDELSNLQEEYNKCAEEVINCKAIRDVSEDALFNTYFKYNNFASNSSFESRIASYEVRNINYRNSNSFRFYDKAGNVIEDVSDIEVAMYFSTVDTKGVFDNFSFENDYNTYKYMTDNEKKIASYLLNTENVERLEDYFDFKLDYANQRQGLELAEEVTKKIDANYAKVGTEGILDERPYTEGDAFQDTLILLANVKVFHGIQNWFDGFKNWASTEAVVSANQYRDSYIVQYLQNRYEDDKFEKVVSIGVNNVFSGIGNMIPSIAISVLTANFLSAAGVMAQVSQTAATVSGSAFMGISAGGNAKQQALQSGMTNAQATVYGILSGASEATFEYLLGGITGLSKLDDIAKNVPGFKGFLLKMFREGYEESLQSVVEPLLETMVTGHYNEIDWGEVLESGIYGALTAGVLNGGELVIGNTSYLISDMSSDVMNSLINKYSSQDLSNPTVQAELQSDLVEYKVKDAMNTEVSKESNLGLTLDSVTSDNGLKPAGDLDSDSVTSDNVLKPAGDLTSDSVTPDNVLKPAGDLDSDSVTSDNVLKPAGDLDSDSVVPDNGLKPAGDLTSDSVVPDNGLKPAGDLDSDSVTPDNVLKPTGDLDSDLNYEAAKNGNSRINQEGKIYNPTPEEKKFLSSDLKVSSPVDVDATAKFIPVSKLLDIIKDDNYFSLFINDYDGNRDFFGNLSQGEYALGLKQFYDAVLKNNYDFGLTQKHVERINFLVENYQLTFSDLPSVMSANDYTESLQRSIDAVDSNNGENVGIHQLYEYLKNWPNCDLNLLDSESGLRDIVSKIDYDTLLECYRKLNKSQTEVKSIKSEIFENIPSGLDDLSKARYLYLELNKRVSYDYGYFSLERNPQKKASYYSQDVSFDTLQGNRVICKGWSQLYYDLLLSAGFDTNRVSIRGGNSIGSHKWIEIEFDDYILRADATDAFDHNFDLSAVKSGFSTHGFILMPKMFAGININHNTVYLSEGDTPKIYEYLKNYGFGDAWLRDIDTRLGFAKDGKYFNETVAELMNDFYSPDVVSKIFGDNLDVSFDNKYNQFASIEIPNNMNAYDACAYLNQLKYILFGKNGEIQIDLYYRPSLDSSIPVGATVVTKYNSDNSISCKIIDDVFGIKTMKFKDTDQFYQYISQLGYE